jgi:hypothetical protein
MRAIAISLLLAAIPVALVVYLAFTGDIGIPPHWTVDGLFMTLILLTISGILALNAVLEANARGLIHLPGLGSHTGATAGGGTAVIPGTRTANTAGLTTEVGVIEHVDYFDAPIGQSNKSFVQIRSKGEKTPHTVVLLGNVRGLLIPGRRMQLAYKPGEGGATLVSFDFA